MESPHLQCLYLVDLSRKPNKTRGGGWTTNHSVSSHTRLLKWYNITVGSLYCMSKSFAVDNCPKLGEYTCTCIQSYQNFTRQLGLCSGSMLLWSVYSAQVHLLIWIGILNHNSLSHLKDVFSVERCFMCAYAYVHVAMWEFWYFSFLQWMARVLHTSAFIKFCLHQSFCTNFLPRGMAFVVTQYLHLSILTYISDGWEGWGYDTVNRGQTILSSIYDTVVTGICYRDSCATLYCIRREGEGEGERNTKSY